jgi:2-oxoisovalerate dehydrogenase E1 component
MITNNPCSKTATGMKVQLPIRQTSLGSVAPARLLAQPRPGARLVGIAGISAVTGGRLITNHDLLAGHPGRTDMDIFTRTGITSRYWVKDGEDPLTLAVRACRSALDAEEMSIADFDAVICTSSTPMAVTPSLACRVLAELNDGSGSAGPLAYDINAACSGYLFALRSAFDLLQTNPDGRVLVVTSEVLSPLLNPEDFGTLCLFGDAASATILCGEEHLASACAHVQLPVLSTKAEDGSLLSVPLPGQGFIRMQGRRVFEQAVRSMVKMLHAACESSQISSDELALVVPHQANQRILDAVARQCPVPVFSNIRHLGNTASTSIPLALRESMPVARAGQKLGLCTFGGGFTFGATILEIVNAKP